MLSKDSYDKNPEWLRALPVLAEDQGSSTHMATTNSLTLVSEDLMPSSDSQTCM